MGKHLKRAASILLCTLLIVSFSACNPTGSNAPASSAASPAASSAASPAAAADPFGKYSPEITINVARTLDSNVKFDTSKQTEASITQNIWASAYKEKLGITLNYLWTPTSDQYDTKWNTAIASNDLPDMAVASAKIYKMLVQGDLVADCTEAYNNYASDYYKACSSAETGDNGIALKVMTSDGKLLGIPQPGASPDNIPILYIRKDWLGKVNMAEPKTIDDLIKTAQAFKDGQLGGPDTYGISMSKDIGTNLRGFFNAYGAYYDIWQPGSSGDLVYGTILPEMKTALLKLQDLYKSGLLRQDFSVLDAAKSYEDIVAGKVGIAYGYHTSPVAWKDTFKDQSAVWEALPLPTVDGSVARPQASAPLPAGYIFVRKGFEYPEAAVKIMNLNLDLFTKDPTHYATGEDGVQVLLYRFASDGAIPWKNLRMMLAIRDAIDKNDTSKLTPEQLLTYNRVQGKDKDYTVNQSRNLIFGLKSSYQIINDVYKIPNLINVDAFHSLPTETMNTMASTLKASLDTAILKVINGDDIGTFDSAVAAWKSGGGDQITKEVNDWYSKNK